MIGKLSLALVLGSSALGGLVVAGCGEQPKQQTPDEVAAMRDKNMHKKMGAPGGGPAVPGAPPAGAKGAE